MIKKISKTQSIKSKLKAEGKIAYLDQQKHVNAIVDMNSQLEIVRREFQIKDRNSQIKAGTIILTS